MQVRVILKSVIASYVITGVLLLFAAFLLYKLEPQQSQVAIGILVIYVLSCFFGGLIAGKMLRNRKFIWGMVSGLVYFLLLFTASGVLGNGIQDTATQVLTTFVLCVAGGMLGGMLA